MSFKGPSPVNGLGPLTFHPRPLDSSATLPWVRITPQHKVVGKNPSSDICEVNADINALFGNLKKIQYKKSDEWHLQLFEHANNKLKITHTACK